MLKRETYLDVQNLVAHSVVLPLVRILKHLQTAEVREVLAARIEHNGPTRQQTTVGDSM